MENENPRFLVFFETENSHFVKNENRGILFFWKARLPEFSFCGKREFGNLWKTRILVLRRTRIREFSFCGEREFSFCGKRELENSRFVENDNRRILFLWKIGIREFPFYAEQESENSRFVENQNWRIFFFWKIRIREISFCGK